MNNRIDAVLENAVKDTIIQKINEIRALLPFLIGLNDNERRGMLKINRDNYLFVKDVLREMVYLPQVLPPYIDVNKAIKDLQLHEQVRGVEERMSSLTTSILDTHTLAGSEAYAAALSMYDHLKRAAKDGVPGAREALARLKPRFEKQGRKKKADADTSTEGQNEEPTAE